MDRSGALPDRCIVCNTDAGGYRLARKLYWSPFAWRLGAVATPFVALGLGAATQTMLLMVLFWPLVLALMIAHTFVRKKLEVELGFCARHRRLRAVLSALSIACVIGVLSSIFVWSATTGLAAALLSISLAGMLIMVVAQSILGVPAVTIKKLSGEHAWLAGTGKPFRAALPERPG